jgi:uncharacterized protein (TIGR04255 family)
MARKRHLTRSPLVEAVVDIQVDTLATFSEHQRAALGDIARGRGFSTPEPQYRLTGSFDFGSQAPSASLVQDSDVFRYVMRSAENDVVVQFRRNGFTLSRLHGYRSWEEHIAYAKEFWTLYASWARPERIVRIAVRYINHLDLPDGGLVLEEYLTHPPCTPAGMPREIVRFLSSTHTIDRELDVQVHLVQATRDAFDTERPVIVLDLDVYKIVNLGADEADMWTQFGTLHELKDATFFGSITEKTAEMLE